MRAQAFRHIHIGPAIPNEFLIIVQHWDAATRQPDSPSIFMKVTCLKLTEHCVLTENIEAACLQFLRIIRVQEIVEVLPAHDRFWFVAQDLLHDRTGIGIQSTGIDFPYPFLGILDHLAKTLFRVA